MVNFENIFIPTLQKLSDLIRRQYGCQFDFLNETELKGSAQDSVCAILKSGKPAISEGALFFPVMPNGTFVGAAQIAGHHKLAERDLANLNQIVRMVLESSLLNVDRLDTLSLLESQLELLKAGEGLNNLIRLHDHRDRPTLSTKDLAKWRLKESLSFPFLIEAQSEEDAFRMALDVHDTSGRNFLTPIEDLESHTFASIESLKSLGPCTIYGTDFQHLTKPIQDLFLSYYQVDRGQRSPQLIVGTTRTISALKADPLINPQFLSRLTAGYLYLSRPYSLAKSGEILDFFL